MQEQVTKEQDYSKTRRASPLAGVETSRLVASNADALREVHMSLVRAEQNLYNLVQASQANGNGQTGAPGFAYGAPQAFATSYPAAGFAPTYAPAFASGYAPASAITTPSGLALGIVPGISPWGSPSPAGLSPWSSLAGGITATPALLQAPAGFAPTAFVPAASPYAAGLANRTPACDISDEGKQFVAQVELPGVTADQIEVVCFARAVIVSAFRENETDVASVVQSERSLTTQQRTIALPNDIQPTGVKATLSNGILTVVLPKVHATEGPRRVKVQG